VQAYESTLDGVRKIVQQEGVLALWRGTSASLLMARAAVQRSALFSALQIPLKHAWVHKDRQGWRLGYDEVMPAWLHSQAFMLPRFALY
jgi:hypothetical protein